MNIFIRILGHTVEGVGIWPLTCWDCGFESRRGHECLSVVGVVCCEVEVSATGRSFVQGSPTECGVSECDLENSTTRRSWHIGGSRAVKKYIFWLD